VWLDASTCATRDVSVKISVFWNLVPVISLAVATLSTRIGRQQFLAIETQFSFRVTNFLDPTLAELSWLLLYRKVYSVRYIFCSV